MEQKVIAFYGHSKNKPHHWYSQFYGIKFTFKKKLVEKSLLQKLENILTNIDYKMDLDQIENQDFFCAEQFKEIGLLKPFVQVNHSMTRKKGAVRGMHYQNIPYAETKLVTCVKGEVADIAIDIREGSKTFLN